MSKLINVAILILLISSCETTNPAEEYGMQPSHEGFIPARIAVLKCSKWPDQAKYRASLQTNVDQATISEICSAFDEFILESFSGQPFMKGFSPKLVGKLLEKNGKTNLLGKRDAHWAHKPDNCVKCKNSAAFYTTSIAKRPNWQLWLNEFSQNTRYADAILMPFVNHVTERRYSNRGLLTAERTIGITLLLVNTSDGSLIWSGGRTVSIPTKALTPAKTLAELSYPPFKNLLTQLFVEQLWSEFPGRQIF